MNFGVLCGLQSEAKIADGLPGALVGCSGARVERARTLAEYLVEKKVRRLLSFGLAAGLSPDVEAGDLLLGATVVSEKGAWEADEGWNARVIDYLPCYQCAPVWGSDEILKTAKDKRICAVKSGCLIADMESHIVARAAVEAGIPFNVLRAVSDPLGVDLPAAALVPLLEDGRPDKRLILSSLYRQPGQIPRLIGLGMGTKKALKSLKHAVRVIAALEKEA